jgi:hypothetical protein
MLRDLRIWANAGNVSETGSFLLGSRRTT